MTRLASLALAAGTLAAAALPQAARAQLSAGNPLSVGLSGGLAAPTSPLSNNVNSGYSVAGMLDVRPAAGPLSLRVEVGYDRFAYKDSYQTYLARLAGGSYEANTHYIRGNANLVYRLGSFSGLRPYVTGGVGVYNNANGESLNLNGATTTYNSGSTTKFGVNGGIGVDVPLSGITVFGEVRAHGVQTDGTPLTYVPVTVGIRF
jgi:hypothetical protein